MAEQSARDFVPAAPQLWSYDALSFLLTKARRWRPALLAQLSPTPDDVIADIGCVPERMAEVGFDRVEETRVFETVSGSMSIYRAVLV